MFKNLLISGLMVLTNFFAPSVYAAPGMPPQASDTLGTDLYAIAHSSNIDPKAKLRVPAEEEESYMPAMLALEDMHPAAASFTRQYELQMGKRLAQLSEKAAPQFHIIETIFAKHGLPAELKYLAIVESQMETRARSHMGAVGPWQFMAPTARNMGLRVTKTIDERKDLTKSTEAAAKYLKSLFKIYGDWLLVIAAYNGGPGNVNSAIKRSGSRNFWVLKKFLPNESRKHVKKYIATQFIMAGYVGLTALTKSETEEYLANNTTDGIEPDSDIALNTLARPISGRYHSLVMIKHLEMTRENFFELNPSFDKIIATKGEYELRLPADKMELFNSRKPGILSESLEVIIAN